MSKNEQLREFSDLVFTCLSGDASEEQKGQLIEILENDAGMREYYVDYLSTYTLLYRRSGASVFMEEIDEPVLNDQLWNYLAYEEKTASAVEMLNDESPEEIIGRVESSHVPGKRTISPWNIMALSAVAASILFIFMFVRFAPVRGKTFGYIIEEQGAVFQEGAADIQIGQSFDDRPVKLKSGLVKLRMNDGATVLLEAPTEVCLESDGQLFLIRGKLTAAVPKEAVGFTVRTPSASVIDYGTQFGVLVDKYARTEAHVLKGQVRLGLGSDPLTAERGIDLSAHQAGRVSGDTLSAIPVSLQQFVYEIPSRYDMRAKVYGASANFGVAYDEPKSFQDMLQNSGLAIQIRPEVSMLPGLAADGKQMWALQVQGEEPSVQISKLDSITQDEQGCYTIALWVRFDSIGQQVVFKDMTFDAADTFRLLMMDEEGRLVHGAYTSDFKGRRITAGPDALKPGTWYFVAVTRTMKGRNEKRLYINGEVAADSVADSAYDVISPYGTLQLGGQTGAIPGMEGQIGNVTLFPKALTKDEVKQLYQSVTGQQGGY